MTDFVERIEEDIGFRHEQPQQPPSVPVHFSNEAPLTSKNIADFGAYRTIVFTGTETPQPLIPYDNMRYRVTIYCYGTAPNGVYIGTEAQTKAPNGPYGFLIQAGASPLRIENNQGAWIVPTAACTVAYMVERYAGSPGGRQSTDGE